ncbi:MAG: WYL domain-containing protein [Anaerolineae bacterium]|nr:MAG: WYL domain-containing protein [Anaerolineae bacterium]
MRSTQDELNTIRELICQTITREAGIRTTELAEMINIPERTMREHLRWLEDRGRIYQEKYNWYPLEDPRPQLRPLTFSPEEGLMLYLAVRLLVKLQDRRSLLSERMLHNLAQALSQDTKIGEYILQAAYQLTRRKQDAAHSRKSETLFTAHINRRWVRLTYQPYNGEPFETNFAPYTFEPSPIGMTIYTHGKSTIVNAMRTYKLERIQDVRLLSEPFEIEEDFDPSAWLKNAASIIGGDEVTEIVLRFSPSVVPRLRENSWFGFQEELIPDGDHLIMRFQVADTTDLKPWIRSWGAACEVLEPAALREEMMGETRRLAELYGWYVHRSTPSQQDDDPLGLNTTLNDFFG